MLAGCPFPVLVFYYQTLSGPTCCPLEGNIIFTNFLWNHQFVNVALNVDGLTTKLQMVNNLLPPLGI